MTLPVEPELTVPVAYVVPLFRIFSPTVAFGTVETVTYRLPPLREYVIDETCAGFVVTVTVADAVAPPASVAVTVAVPVAAGVNVVDAPEVVDSEPVDVDQVTLGVTRLPNASAPVTVNVCDEPSWTLALAGESVSDAMPPAVIVSVCVAAWRPAALAVIVGVPAVVSS